MTKNRFIQWGIVMRRPGVTGRGRPSWDPSRPPQRRIRTANFAVVLCIYASYLIIYFVHLGYINTCKLIFFYWRLISWIPWNWKLTLSVTLTFASVSEKKYSLEIFFKLFWLRLLWKISWDLDWFSVGISVPDY